MLRPYCCRDIFQFHPGHGGGQCGPHRPRPQLSPQEPRHAHYANLGRNNRPQSFFMINENVYFILQSKRLFLQWLPWLLRYNRPSKKITMKSILMDHKMAAKISKYSSVPNSPIHQKIQVHENGVNGTSGLPNGNFRLVYDIIILSFRVKLLILS